MEVNTLQALEGCLLQKLARDVDECENHHEYRKRHTDLPRNVNLVIQRLNSTDLQQHPKITTPIISILLIFYEELKTDGAWNTDQCKTYAGDINAAFQMVYGHTLDQLWKEDNIFNSQNIFEGCLDYLNKKLSVDMWKRFPSLMEVYLSLVNNVKDYNVNVKAHQVLPITLMLIEDTISSNKMKGLKSCHSILNVLTASDLGPGNHHEVMHRYLVKASKENDLEVTNLSIACLMKLMDIVSQEVKYGYAAGLFPQTLEQLYIESNLYRKSIWLNFATYLVKILGPDSVKKKKQIDHILCDHLDMCCVESVTHILVPAVLDFLETWLSYGWAVWLFSRDKETISKLFKLLYVIRQQEDAVKRIQMILATLMEVSTEHDRLSVRNDLDWLLQELDERRDLEELVPFLKEVIPD